MTNALDIRKLPNLKALKGFEAAARLQSVRGAADELNLTHPAITHQIQILEESLEFKLFERKGRNIALTQQGELYYPFVRNALEYLIKGKEALVQSAECHPLRIQAYVTNSIRWLAPRLPKFKAVYPDIELHLTTCSAHWEFDEMNADIGLIYRCGPVPDHLHWTKLFKSTLFPVCSPKLVEGFATPVTSADLITFPLIAVYTEDWNWEDWFTQTVPDSTPPPSALEVDTLAIALEMAINGEGVALVNGPSAKDDLAAGRLVQVVPKVVAAPGEWGAICHKNSLEDQRVKLFIAWLQEEAAK